jgi:hypothetical protein
MVTGNKDKVLALSGSLLAFIDERCCGKDSLKGTTEEEQEDNCFLVH